TPQHVDVTDPDTGQPLRTAFPVLAPDVSGDPSNGNLYAVWEDGRWSGGQHDAIAFSMSTDAGFTWSEPIQINQTPTNIEPGNQQAFLPTIQVAQDGTVGVTYYDFRFNDPQPGLATDYWFVYARPDDPGGLTDPANWAHELRLTNRSFDMERAPNARGFFVGDYVGLASAGNNFRAFWAQPGRMDPATIFFRHIHERHYRRHGGDEGRTGEGAAAATFSQPLPSGPSPVTPTAVTSVTAAAYLCAGDLDQTTRQLSSPLAASSSRPGGYVHERVFAEFDGDWLSEGMAENLFAKTRFFGDAIALPSGLAG